MSKSDDTRTPPPDLQALREELEAIDREILELLDRRMERVEEVGRRKLEAAFPFRDAAREEQVLQRVREAATERGLDPAIVERLYRLIMEMSISRQQAHIRALDTVPLRIAYQGVEGSYSHLTAQRRYRGRRGGVLLTGFPSVREAADAVRHGHADAALLPIENSTAGSVYETYDELARGGLTINAEVTSSIEHCLVALPGVDLEEIREVLSHPQALDQCEAFLRRLSVTTRAEFDTAGAARKVRELGRRPVAAIASASAAEMHGLAVVQRGIESQAGNATRFVEVAVEAEPCPDAAPCLTSLVLELRHEPGALGEVLTAIGRRGLNVSKVESRPLPGTPWRYCFYLDIDAHGESAPMVAALEEIGPLTASVRLLGTYPRAV